MPPRPGDLILYREHDPVSWAIRVCSTAPVNHVAVVDEWGAGVIEATHNGVRRGPLPDLADADHWLWPIRGDGLTAAEWAAARIGQPYGWALYGGFARRLLHLTFRHRSPRRAYRETLVCSTLAVAAWRAAGRDPLPGLAEALATPGDLFCALARLAAPPRDPQPARLRRVIARSGEKRGQDEECAA